MNIVTIGTGYVGLTTATCMAELGNSVIGVDINAEKVAKLQEGSIPLYERGLEEMVQRNQAEGRLYFTTSLEEAMSGDVDVIFIAVQTPAKENGEANLEYVKTAARDIGKYLKDYAVIINKSTVPIGTGNLVEAIIKEEYDGEFDVVSNPEFLKQGTSVDDFLRPDRVVIGCNGNKRAEKIMKELYRPLNCPIVTTDLETAEMIKYASNSLLATTISFMNSIARVCEEVGANVDLVAEGMRLDKRIGKSAFLSAGIGYGGSCFPKDVKALIQIAKDRNINFDILEHVDNVNESQKTIAVQKLKNQLPSLSGKTIALWGLAFKPQTDDMREAPSINIVNELQKEGATIIAFDPVAQSTAKRVLSNIDYAQTPYDALEEADALIIATEWNSFIQLDKIRMRETMKNPIIIDGRNVYNPREMEELGFIYTSIGRPTQKHHQ